MEHVSILTRDKSPYFWMSFLDSKSGKRLTRSTKLRTDQPSNRRRAYELALKRSQEAKAIKPIADHSAWSMWGPEALKERYGLPSQKKTLERMERCYRVLELFFAEKGIVGPTQIDANTPSAYVTWRETTHPRRSGKRSIVLFRNRCHPPA